MQSAGTFAFLKQETDRFVLLGVGMLVIYLTVVPLGFMLYGSLRSQPPGYLGTYTIENYVRALTSDSFLRSFWNSIVFSFFSGLVSFAIGSFLAWATERTNAPFRGVVYASALISIIVPGILVTISWILLLSPGIGLLNHIAMSLFSLDEAPFNAFSLGGMIWVFGSDHFSVPFLLMAAAFRSMDPALEDAARTCGASGVTTFRTVTMKLCLPAVLAAWLLVFIRGLETFEAPAILGIPAGVRVLATEILLATRSSLQPDYNLAAAYGAFYILITVIGLYLYHRATRFKEKFAVITGRGFRPSRMRLGRWRYLVGLAILVILFIVVYLPILILFYTSFLPWYMVPSLDVIKQMNLENYEWVVSSPKVVRAFWNNLVVGVTSATLTVFLTAVIGWIVVRTRLRGRQFLDMLCFAPVAFPGMVFGLSLLWVYLILPVPVYGTLWILIIAYVSKFMPIAIRANVASLMQIAPELEEISNTCGATWTQTFRKVLVPLIIPGLLVGWIYVLSLTFKVLSIPILLAGVGIEIIPLLVFDLYEGGEYTKLTALGSVTIAFVVSLSLCTRWLVGRWGIESSPS